MNSSVGIDPGSTAWLMVCSALVFLLTIGLELFYSGRLRERYLVSFCVIVLQWTLWGYSLAFGSGGSFTWFGLHGVGVEPDTDFFVGVPHLAFATHQALVSFIPIVMLMAACGDRMKSSAYFIFILLWSTFVYAPVTHWISAPSGYLRAAGAMDGAGAVSVHWSAGLSAFVVFSVFKRRLGPEEVLKFDLHPGLLTPLGAVLLWLGWLGWVAGSSSLSGGQASLSVISSLCAAAAGGLGWTALDRFFDARLTTQGMLTGVLAGLVASSAGPLFVGGSIVLGVGASVLVYATLALWKNRWGADDSINIFGVHAAAALWGLVLVSLWSLMQQTTDAFGAPIISVVSHVALAVQLKAILSVAMYSLLATWILLKGLDFTIGVRHQIRHN